MADHAGSRAVQCLGRIRTYVYRFGSVNLAFDVTCLGLTVSPTQGGLAGVVSFVSDLDAPEAEGSLVIVAIFVRPMCAVRD